VTLDLPDDLVLRLRREAERRSMSLDALVSELAFRLPAVRTEAGDAPRLGFFALGASTDGRGAASVDEILADGFAQD